MSSLSDNSSLQLEELPENDTISKGALKRTQLTRDLSLINKYYLQALKSAPGML